MSDKDSGDLSSPDGLAANQETSEVAHGRGKKSVVQRFVGWIKEGKIEFTKKLPFQRKGEKFKGFKITWKW